MKHRILAIVSIATLVGTGACMVAPMAAPIAAPMAAPDRADPMAEAANALIQSLDVAQQSSGVYDFADAERRNWQPVPFGEAGVRLDAMTDAQRDRVTDLLRSALSEDGVATVAGVRVLEGILVAGVARCEHPLGNVLVGAEMDRHGPGD